MQPNHLIARAYLSRGARMWLVTRLAMSAVFCFAEENPLWLASGATVVVIVLSVVAGFVDVRRRRESALLGNLGVSSGRIAIWFAIPAFIGEIVVHAIGFLTL